MGRENHLLCFECQELSSTVNEKAFNLGKSRCDKCVFTGSILLRQMKGKGVYMTSLSKDTSNKSHSKALPSTGAHQLQLQGVEWDLRQLYLFLVGLTLPPVPIPKPQTPIFISLPSG